MTWGLRPKWITVVTLGTGFNKDQSYLRLGWGRHFKPLKASVINSMNGNNRGKGIKLLNTRELEGKTGR